MALPSAGPDDVILSLTHNFNEYTRWLDVDVKLTARSTATIENYAASLGHRPQSDLPGRIVRSYGTVVAAEMR